jgi:hypothetical protein
MNKVEAKAFVGKLREIEKEIVSTSNQSSAWKTYINLYNI